MNAARRLLLGAALVLAGLATACIGPTARGSFDRTLTVKGPVRLYLTNGSGDAHVRAGAPGQVRIHAVIRVRAWVGGNAQRRVQEIAKNPPIRQEGSLIHVGFERYGNAGVTADYTIEAPPDTELHSVSGSGDVTVAGLAGPVRIIDGSGDLSVSNIQGDVHTTDGSGDVRMENIKGSAQITAGSGDVVLRTVGGRVRVTTGSGDIALTSPGSAVTLRNGSGDVRVNGAADDLRVHSGSGTVDVGGSPATGAYWELHAGSGDVSVRVPSDASFRFSARTRMGDIHSDIPMTIVERHRHDLRAIVGQGSARVEVETGTGEIRLNHR
jgi:hypothetical protein